MGNGHKVMVMVMWNGSPTECCDGFTYLLHFAARLLRFLIETKPSTLIMASGNNLGPLLAEKSEFLIVFWMGDENSMMPHITCNMLHVWDRCAPTAVRLLEVVPLKSVLGQRPQNVAQRAGSSRPARTRVLLASPSPGDATPSTLVSGPLARA